MRVPTSRDGREEGRWKRVIARSAPPALSQVTCVMKGSSACVKCLRSVLEVDQGLLGECRDKEAVTDKLSLKQ